MKKRETKRQPFIRFLFLAYILVLIWLLFGRSQGWTDDLSYRQMLVQNMNLVPLLTIKNYWHVVRHGTNQALLRHCIINLVGNVVLFIPVGYLPVRIWPKLRNFFLFLLSSLGMILAVEALQLFTLLGKFDVDDVILNMTGMLLGYLICIITRKK